MNITNFDELLAVARAQPTRQRLLLVFAAAEPGADATPEQRAAFAEGHGGELTPMMCVDKSVEDIASFASLVDESRQEGPPWAIVFAAALSETVGLPRDSRAIETTLQRMVECIRRGELSGMIPFDTTGEAVAIGQVANVGP